MDFELTEDQKAIQQIVQDFFQKEWSVDRTREIMADPNGYDPALWKKMTDLGYTRLMIPEVYEGTDGDFFELMLLMEEMGRHLVPSPFFTTVCQCVPAIIEYGCEKQKAAILPQIGVKGEIWSLALHETHGDYEASDIQLEAIEKADAFILNGVKLFVPYANSADKLLVIARSTRKQQHEEGITLFMVDAKQPGVGIEVMPTVARDMRCEVKLNNVRVSKENILGELDMGWDIVEFILQYATVLKCAEMYGGVDVVLKIATKYARQRQQFGKVIGSFQAVQHKLVDVLTEVDALKRIVYKAAWLTSIGSPSKMVTSMAKAKANTVCHKACLDAMMIHGAIGFTKEMDVGLYRIREKANEFECCGSDFHLQRIATELENYEPPCNSDWYLERKLAS